MTLEPYDPRKLDEFALRLLDLAGVMRGMARRSRHYQVEDLALHDKKAQEWCTKLGHWARKAQADLEMRIAEARAQRRADSAVEDTR
jgi:hypothetical protein